MNLVKIIILFPYPFQSKEKMMKGVRRGCVRLKGAVIGIDDQDVNTFTITVDHKTFHFQVIGTHNGCNFLPKFYFNVFLSIISPRLVILMNVKNGFDDLRTPYFVMLIVYVDCTIIMVPAFRTRQAVQQSVQIICKLWINE